MKKMSDVDQIVNNIREEITSPEPSVNLIINQFYDLRNLLWKELPRFYDIVGETFTLDPEFFMESIYAITKFFHNRDMAKYIIEKFCLYEGEQILYEFRGDIKQVDEIQSNIRISVSGGTIFITNYRIIAQGTPKIKGHSINAYLLGGSIAWLLSGGSKRAKSGKSLNEASLRQELPCYGYQFKRKNLFGLKKKVSSVKYAVHSDNIQNMSGASRFKQARTMFKETRIITITPPKELIDELFDHLLREDVDQIVDRIRGTFDMRINKKIKRKAFLKGLRSFRELEEYRYLSDSDYLDIVKEIYKLDPEFFMTSIYPEIVSWNFPSFLSVKEKVITLVDTLNKEFVPSRPEQGDESIVKE